MATDLELMRQLRNDAAALLQRAETVSRLLPGDVRCAVLGERIQLLRRTIWEYDQEIMTARENQIGSGIVGEKEGGDPTNDAEHIGLCPYCGQAVDLRDLSQGIHHNTPGHGPIPADA